MKKQQKPGTEGQPRAQVQRLAAFLMEKFGNDGPQRDEVPADMAIRLLSELEQRRLTKALVQSTPTRDDAPRRPYVLKAGVKYFVRQQGGGVRRIGHGEVVMLTDAEAINRTASFVPAAVANVEEVGVPEEETT